MNEKFYSSKKFWVVNRDRILIGTTVTAVSLAVIMRIGLVQHDDFLKEHNLYEAFYELSE